MLTVAVNSACQKRPQNLLQCKRDSKQSADVNTPLLVLACS